MRKAALIALLMMPMMACAWGNRYYADTTGTYVRQEAPTQTVLTPSPEYAKALKCANLIAEARMYSERRMMAEKTMCCEENRVQRQKNWERINKLQPLIEKYCEHE